MEGVGVCWELAGSLANGVQFIGQQQLALFAGWELFLLTILLVKEEVVEMLRLVEIGPGR